MAKGTKVTYNADKNYSGRAFGANFKDGSAELTDEAMIAKASANPHFTVAGNKDAKANAKATEDNLAMAAADAPPRGDAHPPMWPESHHKESVSPSGMVMAADQPSTAAEDDEAVEAAKKRANRGRPKKAR